MNIYPPGAQIAGQYEVVGRPLMGGMGIVYLCLEHQSGLPVALKTFRPEFLPDRAARDRFLREGTTWVNLGSHPHIVRCYLVIQPGVGLEVYLVLELVAKEPGRADASLRSWLMPDRPLPLEQALLFALQIARAMTHATAVIPDFVHRDLKPENVLVGRDKLPSMGVNRLRVTDFGLAAALETSGAGRRAAEDDEPESSARLGRTQLTRGVVGTPLYMAPEQWRGEEVTVHTDIYALGCILYEMLAGHRMVEGQSIMELERAHCAGELRPLPDGMSGAVAEVVEWCLAWEPGARYGSWEEVEEALGAAYAEVTGHAAPGPEPTGALFRAERVAGGWSYSEIGYSYLGIGKPKIAAGYLERAVEIGREEEDQRLKSAALSHLGIAYRLQGELKQALTVTKQALMINREIGNMISMVPTLTNLGECYRQLGWLEEAIRCQQQSLAIAYRVGDREGQGIALGNLGSCYYQLGHWEKAVHTLKEAMVSYREIGDRHGEMIALGNLGNCYLQTGCPEDAVRYQTQSLAIAREIGDRTGEGNALGNLGNCYRQLGWLEEAQEAWRASVVVKEEIGNVIGIANTYFNLSCMLVQQGQLQEALPLAERAAQIWIRSGVAQDAQDARQLVAQIRAAMR